MRQRTIGNVQVSAIGLGGMLMSIEGRPDPQRSIDTIPAAPEAGDSVRAADLELTGDQLVDLG